VYIIIPVVKAEFSASHDTSEIILIWWFAARNIVKNNVAA